MQHSCLDTFNVLALKQQDCGHVNLFRVYFIYMDKLLSHIVIDVVFRCFAVLQEVVEVPMVNDQDTTRA